MSPHISNEQSIASLCITLTARIGHVTNEGYHCLQNMALVNLCISDASANSKISEKTENRHTNIQTEDIESC